MEDFAIMAASIMEDLTPSWRPPSWRTCAGRPLTREAGDTTIMGTLIMRDLSLKYWLMWKIKI